MIAYWKVDKLLFFERGKMFLAEVEVLLEGEQWVNRFYSQWWWYLVEGDKEEEEEVEDPSDNIQILINCIEIINVWWF